MVRATSTRQHSAAAVQPLAPTLPVRGLPAQGWIVFDVPRAARAFTLVYAPELVGATKSELAIDLGR